ncbi:MAG: hypothetical protein QM636_10465 [Rhizobium sp.]
MSSNHQKDIFEAAVNYAFAKAQLAATASYLERGRQYRDILDECLEEQWVETFRTWSALSSTEARRANDDLTAEIELRRKEIPLSRVGTELRILLTRASAVTKDEAARQISGHIMDAYLKAIDEQH